MSPLEVNGVNYIPGLIGGPQLCLCASSSSPLPMDRWSASGQHIQYCTCTRWLGAENV